LQAESADVLEEKQSLHAPTVQLLTRKKLLSEVGHTKEQMVLVEHRRTLLA
jgi:hypothetical protein